MKRFIEAKSFSYEAVNKDKAPTKSSQLEILCPVEILKIAKSDKATMEKWKWHSTIHYI